METNSQRNTVPSPNRVAGQSCARARRLWAPVTTLNAREPSETRT